MAKIIGIGNALVDILVPLADETVLTELRLAKAGMWHVDEAKCDEILLSPVVAAASRATGGSSGNTIHALSVLGNETAFIGTVGDDAPGRFFAERLRSRGIEDRLTMVGEGRTGLATTFITADGERTFATFLGVAPLIDVDGLHLERYAAAAGERPNILHVEGYLVQNHDVIEQVLVQAKKAGLLVSYDLASWNIVRSDHAFVHHLVEQYVDIVFANEEEAKAFADTDDAEVALDMLATLVGTVVVKVGARGAWGRRGTDRHLSAPVFCPRVVDTTAAGDFFAAGFLHGFVREWPLANCLDMGNRLACKVIQVLGTQIDDESLRLATL